MIWEGVFLIDVNEVGRFRGMKDEVGWGDWLFLGIEVWVADSFIIDDGVDWGSWLFLGFEVFFADLFIMDNVGWSFLGIEVLVAGVFILFLLKNVL